MKTNKFTFDKKSPHRFTMRKVFLKSYLFYKVKVFWFTDFFNFYFKLFLFLSIYSIFLYISSLNLIFLFILFFMVFFLTIIFTLKAKHTQKHYYPH